MIGSVSYCIPSADKMKSDPTRGAVPKKAPEPTKPQQREQAECKKKRAQQFALSWWEE